ncbi:MAG: SAM-dependent methyltransferase, partial [Prevotellaceae bacterium]|nr:SAM-dependent methyltransferase [Prevotellaceae bacterium]
MNTLNKILQTLGIDTANGLYYTNETKWKTDLHLSSRVERCLEQINPDAFFCFDNKPLILFFVRQIDNDLHKKIWNINEVPVIIVVNNNSVEIYNGFNLLANKNTLEKLGDERLTDFSYFQLVTGKTWETYEKELNYKNRVDYKLLDNIGAAREQVIKQFPSIDKNDEETKKRYVKIANALLGKIIFVRYLIDRKVKIYFDKESKERTNEEFCNILQQPDRAKQFFNTLADKDVGFNGDLFRLEDAEYQEVPKGAYSILIKLLKSQEIATGQQSFFDLYDFSIIPIEFISNVYEYFIGSKNQAKQGAYYTPLFLVDYILSETIERFISDNQIYNCKVLDPACGSGVFLVETLRKMIEKYKENAPEDREKFKNGIKDIAQNNIYGIDKDESAIQVSIFSIYITLLDYMKPPEIADFKFPKLKDTNFFCADFFDKEAKFNAIFEDIKFDYIVGNPPWFRGKNEIEKPLYVKYIDERRKKENQQDISIDIGNKEIAQAFLLRSSDFCAKNTKCALIVTSKVLYNLQSKNFRKYFLHNYLIERVFELAPVRREVFDSLSDKAVAPACVLFFRFASGSSTDTNIIEHIALKPSRFFSMFKIFSIYRHDIQTVQQDRLKKYDWLWKVLVYGSYLDFNFIKRLNDK